MDRAFVHGSTFSKNDLAMAAGLATLTVLEDEQLCRARREPRRTRCSKACAGASAAYELVKEVRGKGMMLAIEFGPPQSLRLNAPPTRSWRRPAPACSAS